MQKQNIGILGTSVLASLMIVMLLPAVGLGSSETYNLEPQVFEAQQGTAFGHFLLVKTNTATGEILQVVQADNLIVDQGLDTMADLIFDDIDLNSNATDSKFEWLEIGTVNTAPTATDTSINTTACARGNDTTVTATSAVSGEFTATIDFAFNGGTCAGAIVETIIANDITGGEILARSVFAVINISSGDTLTVTYDITIT